MNNSFSLLEAFVFGCLGGFLAEVTHLFTLRESIARRVPGYLKSKLYWTITILMILSGGILALTNLYQAPGTPLFAVQIGILAPMLIHKLSWITSEPRGSKSGTPRKQTWLSMLRGE